MAASDWDRLMDTYAAACKRQWPNASWCRTSPATEQVLLAVVLDTITLCGEHLAGFPDCQPELVALKQQLKATVT